tara:strand:- start:153 stop:1211 length:1059 start_codon:yes stop_codon:yes gene_type:complete
MGSNNLKDLMEAYNSVYASQQVDEGLGSAVKKLFSGKKKEEAPKPMSRGEQLRKKYKVGPERSDTSAKRQILDRTRAKAERDQKQYGGSVYTKRVADKSKAAHDRYLKGGYSKYGADDRRGSGNKARKRAAALNREEFDIFDAVLEFLQVEGYAETLEQAEWMMANVIDEEAIEIITEISKKTLGSYIKKAASDAADRSFDHGESEKRQYEPDDDDEKESNKLANRQKGIKRAVNRLTKEEHVDEEKVTRIRGEFKKPKPLTPLPKSSRKSGMEKLEKGREAYNKSREVASRNLMRQEEYVDEAQEARNNPEKYEREQAKKSAPVRGERTPMPPRGDKRREDFEKWYAKNVR